MSTGGNPRTHLPRAIRWAVPAAVLIQIVPAVLSPDLAFAAARGNSGDSGAYAEIYLLVLGVPLLAAALAVVKWPRGAVLLAALIEVILVAETGVTNTGAYAGAVTPFVIATTAVMIASFVLAWFGSGSQ